MNFPFFSKRKEAKSSKTVDDEFSARMPSRLQLRSQRLRSLPPSAVKEMLNRHNFYCAALNWNKEWSNSAGRGASNLLKHNNDGQTVYDALTGLTWQQSSSSEEKTFIEAHEFIRELNSSRFAGSSEWRLPTLEEAMSLMKQSPKSPDRYIDTDFFKTQHGEFIWTCDLWDASVRTIRNNAWGVNFVSGVCSTADIDLLHVRAVRSESQVTENKPRFTEIRNTFVLVEKPIDDDLLEQTIVTVSSETLHDLIERADREWNLNGALMAHTFRVEPALELMKKVESEQDQRQVLAGKFSSDFWHAYSVADVESRYRYTLVVVTGSKNEARQ